MRIAVLSNINMDSTVRLLQRNLEVFKPEGYGNELGSLINPASALQKYSPEIMFIIEDLLELVGHELDVDKANVIIEEWFSHLSMALQDDVVYYIADAFAYGAELDVLVDKSRGRRLELLWQENLNKLYLRPNVRIFPYNRLVCKVGTINAFSTKMWYMGKILHSMELQKVLAREIEHCVAIEVNVPKKVLLLDLDNTLWGGLAGENDLSPVELSEDHVGLAFKNLQRVILQMKRQGVLLGIVSKNNEDDALEIIKHHPHMLLHENDFAVMKINWQSKAENIQNIAAELSLGLDSMVFFDDSPTERQLIREFLPEVSVPDFPDNPEELPVAMAKIWRQYFARGRLLKEDMLKTQQYAANAKRVELSKCVHSFEEYLAGLEIEIIRNNPVNYKERILQLLNKTNQFNLTTKRHTVADLSTLMKSQDKSIFVYTVRDRFGDNGVVAVVLVDIARDVPVISEFVMSCRVMGKNIENAIIDDVENVLQGLGYDSVIGDFVPSDKNRPVADLYVRLGYERIADSGACQRYMIYLNHKVKRNYCARIFKEEM